MICNALTIDVEDYFQVYAFSKVVRYEDWEKYECRIEQNTNRILELLDSNGAQKKDTKFNNALSHGSPRATFFILGWIAKRFPALIRRIGDLGHEIACHGYAHKPIYHQSKKEFREDVKKAKAILEDITGDEVIGYRAPMYSVTNRSRWALEILIEEGFQYDSSIFPIRHDVYGFRSAPRFLCTIHLNGSFHNDFQMLELESNSKIDFQNVKCIVEFPPSTIRMCGQNIPISGGGYFRLFPYWFTKRALISINHDEKKPFIFYLHPWEFDCDQPRIRGAGLKSYFRHYNNLNKTESRFKRLLEDFRFSSIKEVLKQNDVQVYDCRQTL